MSRFYCRNIPFLNKLELCVTSNERDRDKVRRQFRPWLSYIGFFKTTKSFVSKILHFSSTNLELAFNFFLGPGTRCPFLSMIAVFVVVDTWFQLDRGWFWRGLWRRVYNRTNSFGATFPKYHASTRLEELWLFDEAKMNQGFVTTSQMFLVHF